MRLFFRANHGGHWTHMSHQWVTFVREMRILPICFHRLTANLSSKIFLFFICTFISLYIFVLPVLNINAPETSIAH